MEENSTPVLLYAATEANDVEAVRKLTQHGASVDLLAGPGETALHAASRCGHADIVEVLLSADANAKKLDQYGWTAVEHATFYGHLKLASRLAEAERPSAKNPETDHPFSTSPPHMRPVKPPKPQQLTNKSMILLTPGSRSSNKNEQPVQFDKAWLKKSAHNERDLMILPRVSFIDNPTGVPGDDHPRQSFKVNPITFYTDDPAKAQVSFDLLSSSNALLARGTIILSEAHSNLASGMSPLDQTIRIPLLDTTTLAPVGQVVYTYLLATPFTHPNNVSNPSNHETYWLRTKAAKTPVIGHRGSGKNSPDTTRVQLGENTIPSFLQAYENGAEWVEFDVQVTRDLIPVIYHDYRVAETGLGAPVHSLTAEQFLHLNDVEPSPNQSSSNSGTGTTSNIHTQHPKPTLSALFTSLPLELGFNIEIKYPQLQESHHHSLPPTHHELNTFIDTILTIIFRHKNDRKIFFSSFNPTVCILLSLKQNAIPVLFLTLAGAWKLDDNRCNSLSNAVSFAQEWGLQGIVPLATALVGGAPRLIRVIQAAGLRVVSWGPPNNNVQDVQLQVGEAVDAVITDEVPEIVSGLGR